MVAGGPVFPGAVGEGVGTLADGEAEADEAGAESLVVDGIEVEAVDDFDDGDGEEGAVVELVGHEGINIVEEGLVVGGFHDIRETSQIACHELTDVLSELQFTDFESASSYLKLRAEINA